MSGGVSNGRTGRFERGDGTAATAARAAKAAATRPLVGTRADRGRGAGEVSAVSDRRGFTANILSTSADVALRLHPGVNQKVGRIRHKGVLVMSVVVDEYEASSAAAGTRRRRRQASSPSCRYPPSPCAQQASTCRGRARVRPTAQSARCRDRRATLNSVVQSASVDVRVQTCVGRTDLRRRDPCSPPRRGGARGKGVLDAKGGAAHVLENAGGDGGVGVRRLSQRHDRRRRFAADELVVRQNGLGGGDGGGDVPSGIGEQVHNAPGRRGPRWTSRACVPQRPHQTPSQTARSMDSCRRRRAPRPPRPPAVAKQNGCRRAARQSS